MYLNRTFEYEQSLLPQGGIIMENIKRIYESVVSLGTYSFSRTNRHNHEMFELEISARDLPNIELKFLQENN